MARSIGNIATFTLILPSVLVTMRWQRHIVPMMQHHPNTIPTPIYYEVTSDGAEKTMSRFFALPSALGSREQAMKFFLKRFFAAEAEQEETLFYLYVRHRDGEMALLVSSQTFQQPGFCFYGLEREVLMYRKERIAVHLAYFDRRYPQVVTILFPRIWQAVRGSSITHYMLANNYWVFLRRKMERYRVT